MTSQWEHQDQYDDPAGRLLQLLRKASSSSCSNKSLAILTRLHYVHHTFHMPNTYA